MSEVRRLEFRKSLIFMKDQKDKQFRFISQPPLLIFTNGANMSEQHCMVGSYWLESYVYVDNLL